MMKRFIALLITMLAFSEHSYAQSNPNLSYGYVPTAAEWNSYFSVKQDYLGSPPLLITGGTMLGLLTTAFPSANSAGFNLPPGISPTLPNNGDLWATSSGLFVQIGGTTYNLLSGGGGGGSPGGLNGQLQYNNAGSFGGFILGGDCTFSVPNITCTKTNGTLFGDLATANAESPPAIGTITPASGAFTTLSATGALTTNVTGTTQCLQAGAGGVVVGTGAPCGGGSTVSSVFGRTGIVTAQPGDYNFNLISGQATLTQLATIGTNTVLGNATAGSTTPSALAVPSCSGANQALTWTTSGGFGCVTISGGGGGGTPGGINGQVQYNNLGVFGGLTNTALTALINTFTSTLSGTVPASGGGTANYLRADGTFQPVVTSLGGLTGSITCGTNVTCTGGVISATGGAGAVTSVFGRTGVVVATTGDYTPAQVNALAIANNLSDVANAATSRTNLGLGTFATQNFATPPAIGGTTPAAGTFSALTVTGTTTVGITGGGTQCVQVSNTGVVSGTGGACPGSSASVTTQTFCTSAGTGCAVTLFVPGTTTSFVLSATPINSAALEVMFDGISQAHNTWSLSTATVTLNAAVPNSTQIVEFRWLATAVGGGTVASVTAGNSTLTISPTTGAVVATLNLGTANTWTATQTFPSNSLTLAEFPTIGANTAIGSIAGGTPAALSTTQFTTLCNIFTSTLSGCVPSSGGGTTTFLRADGTFAVPSSSSITTQTFCATAGTGCSATTFTPGTTSTFTLSASPLNSPALEVMFDGVSQAHNTWSLSTNVVTLDSPVPTSTQVVEFRWLATAIGGAAVTTVSASNSTLSISPTSGAVLASINLGSVNTWTAVQTFPNNSLTLAEFPMIAANTAIGSIAGGTPAALTATQFTTLCNAFTSTLSGCVPLSGGGTSNFLRSDGTWTSPSASLIVGSSGITGGTTTRVLYDNAGVLGEYTNVQLTALCQTFTSLLSGCVPLSGGGVTTFLRADGTFAIPSVAASLTVGTTTVSGGTTTRVLFDNAGVLGEYTNAQLTSLCQTFTSTLSGCVPSSGGGTTTFLRADGTFATPAGGGGSLTVGTTTIAGGTNGRVEFNNAGVLGEYTNVQLTALCQAFTSLLSGCVPLSGGGTVKFLRADGTWTTTGTTWFNVNNYASLQLALTAAAGVGCVYIPGGTTVSISAAVNMPSVGNTCIIGDGPSSIIQNTSTTANTINNGSCGNYFNNFTINYSSQAGTGAIAFNSSPSTCAAGQVSQTIMQNVYIIQSGIGIEMTGVNTEYYNNIIVQNYTNAAFYLNGSTINQNVNLTNFGFFNIGSYLNVGGSTATIWFAGNNQGIEIAYGEAYGAAGFSLWMTCTSNGAQFCSSYNKIIGVYFDSAKDGVGGSTAQGHAQIDRAYATSISDSWFSGGRNTSNGSCCYGLWIGGGQGITLQGNTFIANGLSGLAIVNGVGTPQWVTVSGNILANNNFNAQSKHGIEIGAGVTDFNLTNNVSVNMSGIPVGGSQFDGILVNVGTSNRYSITGNLITPNSNAGVVDNGSGGAKAVSGNF